MTSTLKRYPVQAQSFCLYLFLVLVFIGNATVAGQKILIEQSDPTGIYAPGETIRIAVSLEGIIADTIIVTLQENFSKEEKIPLHYRGMGQVIFERSYDGPVSVACNVRVNEEWAATGFVVDPYQFAPGFERPKDFKSYWKQEKKTLRNLPMEIKQQKVESKKSGYVCYDTEINCTGPKPARGYFAKPADAGKGSLPAVLIVHAAGVKGSWCLSKPEAAIDYASRGEGALCFDLNAHGMLNGQPQTYYDSLEAGPLNGYYYQGIESRENFYFRGMYLRLLRTLDFLASQPEWDGKRIIVIGESQGGGQALAAVGLDPRVSDAVAIVPAMCDWGGPLAGRKGGWPDPYKYGSDKVTLQQVLPYYDCALLLEGSKANLFVEIGLIDRTCPPNTILAAVNQAKGEKTLMFVPYRGHHVDQQQFRKEWEQNVYAPRQSFIEQFFEK